MNGDDDDDPEEDTIDISWGGVNWEGGGTVLNYPLPYLQIHTPCVHAGIESLWESCTSAAESYAQTEAHYRKVYIQQSGEEEDETD